VREVAKKKSSKKEFRSSEEMDHYLEESDLSSSFSIHGKLEKPKIKKVNLDLPEWLLSALDFEADRAGVARQPLIKIWLSQKIDEERAKRQKPLSR